MPSRNVIILQLRNPVGKSEPLPVLRVYDDIHMLRLKRALFEDTLHQAAQVENADIKVAVAPPARSVWGKEAVASLARRYGERRAFQTLAERCEVIGQGVAPIAARTAENLRAAIKAGYKHILLMSGYLPTIRAEQIADALKYLAEHPIILGPTIEGGCYLVGLRSDCPEAAPLVSVGSDTSYKDSTEALAAAGLAWQEIDLCYDISHQEDLEFIVREINHARFTGDEEIGLCTEAVISEFMNEPERKAAANHRKKSGR
jgi:glycosyltransferase A (GT-A) superfamily protein (DUF2064 family)